MIKIRTLYIVLPLTILMAVGCYLKGWTAGIALWALPCARVRGAHPARAEGEERRGGRAEKRNNAPCAKKGRASAGSSPFCCRFRRLSAAICALRGLHFAAKPL